MDELLVSASYSGVNMLGIPLTYDLAYQFPKALERLEELKKSGKARLAPVNGKLARNQKRDEAECAVM